MTNPELVALHIKADDVEQLFADAISMTAGSDDEAEVLKIADRDFSGRVHTLVSDIESSVAHELSTQASAAEVSVTEIIRRSIGAVGLNSGHISLN